MKENKRIEFKRELSPKVDLEKEIIAFLNNQEGGMIYIGVDNDGNKIGVNHPDQLMLTIKDRIKNNVSPSAMGLFDIVLEERDGLDIIKIIVASGSEKPYFKKKYGMTEKGSFIRIGSSTEAMKQATIEKLFAGRTRNSIGKIKSPRQDLSFEQLRIYYEERKRPLNRRFKTNLELTNENGDLNYAAYLLADENGMSVKVAKYADDNRVDLIESNEYGYCSLVKATKSVLDKLDTENFTRTKITGKERIEQRQWSEIALREAVINAMVHGDYTREIPPKFEIFSDRIEITSAGSLPDRMAQDEFFEGYSIPRNKELMRIFKDLEMVEQLGTGIHRILKHYGKDCFHFTENFTRVVFPNVEKGLEKEAGQELGQETYFSKVLFLLVDRPMSRKEIAVAFNLKSISGHLNRVIFELFDKKLIEMTLPEKPKSSKQQYKLTIKGKAFLNMIEEKRKE